MALVIPLLKADENTVYMIGKKVLNHIDCRNEQEIVNSLHALARVVSALTGTLGIIREDLGDDYGCKEFLNSLRKTSRYNNVIDDSRF